MVKELNELEQEAQESLQRVTEESALAGWRSAYLGRKGKVTEAVKALSTLPSEARPAYGRRVNEVKLSLEMAYEAKLERLTRVVQA